MAKRNNFTSPVQSIKHKDTRANIPTEELRDFVAEEEQAPKALRYPRDPSLDPQLVWKGKDEQDATDLAVPVVPIYIQEKIQPQAIIEDLRAHAKTKGDCIAEDMAAYQTQLFADFNGLPEDFDQRVDFYHHQGHWSNRMILGDSLLIMTSLAEKEGLKGKVQCIYFDPPYGIKFGSNWQVSTRKRDVKDGKAEDATRQPEQIRAFRDTWKLGIHSYLAYLRDRLTVARELLTEPGSIFVQIGIENVHLVRSLMDEIFGADNFVSLITFRTTANLVGNFIGRNSDYIVWFSKSLEHVKYRQLYSERGMEDDIGGRYSRVQLSDDTRRVMISEERSDISKLPANSEVYRHDNLTIERCLLMATDPGDLVLDPTCGSGTAAYVAEQWGRRWITCDTSRVALALARTRLMAAKYPYYLLADSPEGVKKEAEITAKMMPNYQTEGDIKKGFVYKRVPHVTLKSIANNEEIDVIHAKWQPKQDAVREKLNKVLKKQWEEWEVPREAEQQWSLSAKSAHTEFWRLRRERQAEIDASIASHGDTELLYDQPYDDKKRIRVSGPFTVESLSPHRVLAAADDNMDDTVSQQEARRQQDFGAMILENLKKAGVQNTKKQERLVFETLEPYAGTWLNAQGTYTDSDGKTKRVAVSLGPEQGTVGPQQVKEAAKEAVQGIGFDLLIICGFAFDPHVTEEVKRYGKLTVLPTRMNPDLAMGNELLKKTGAGNLFTVFGEPDIAPLDKKTGKLKPQADGRYVVEIKGLDIYDPTTGEIRSASTDDIACWFIDTDYNGESFFVRHAYFTGADEPYEKLKRALRAEIDEAAWASLNSTTSRPFEKPKTGKIAIKVINHYGDEVLKVFEV